MSINVGSFSGRGRYWGFIAPSLSDSLFCREVLDSSLLPYCVSPLHDHAGFLGAALSPHFHFVVFFYTPISCLSFYEIFPSFPFSVYRVYAIKDYLRYLITAASSTISSPTIEYHGLKKIL